MPSNVTAKIKWVRKRPVLYIATALTIFVALITIHTLPTLWLSRASYTLEIVSTPESQKQGLSGRAHLARNKGMLFAYSTQTERCFWMKDMQFPIDIIWADQNKKVTHIETAVSPKSYPKTFCALGQYVFELNAHEADRNNLKEGQTLTF